MRAQSSTRRNRKYSPGWAQVEPGDPSSEADAPRASGRAEDTREKLEKLENTSERVCELSERKGRQDSPNRPGEGPEEPDNEAVVPGDPQNDSHPRSVSDERIDRMNAPSLDKAPGGHIDDQEALRDIEGDSDCGTVVDGAEHDGVCPSSCGNERRIETDARSRRTRPGGHMGKPKASRDVKGDWSHESDGDGVGYNGRRDGKDGTTSGTRRDSQRVETRPLAGDKGQSQQVECDITTDIPEASTPPPNDPKRPVELPNLPRCRGRLKSCTRKMRRSTMRRSTHQVIPLCRGQSSRIERIGYVAYTVERLGEQPTATMNEKDRPSDDPGEACAAETARPHSRGATFHIRKVCECCTFALLNQ